MRFCLFGAAVYRFCHRSDSSFPAYLSNFLLAVISPIGHTAVMSRRAHILNSSPAPAPLPVDQSREPILPVPNRFSGSHVMNTGGSPLYQFLWAICCGNEYAFALRFIAFTIGLILVFLPIFQILCWSSYQYPQHELVKHYCFRPNPLPPLAIPRSTHPAGDPPPSTTLHFYTFPHHER